MTEADVAFAPAGLGPALTGRLDELECLGFDGRAFGFALLASLLVGAPRSQALPREDGDYHERCYAIFMRCSLL